MINKIDIINYYYDFIVQSSLNSLAFSKDSGNIDKKELQDINYFLIKYGEEDKKTYQDNICYLIKHLNSLNSKNLENYKIIYFPFVNEFIEISNNRENKIYTTPIYFIFAIDKNFKKNLIELKNIAINNRSKYINSIFKDCQVVFNNYYASNKLYVINYNELETFKEEISDKEFDNQYSNKDFNYYISILKKYIEASNLKSIDMDKDTFIDILQNFDNQLKEKLNSKKNLNTFVESEPTALIGVINVENLMEQDNIVRGLLNAYKNSIIPHIKEADYNDKISRILYFHPSKYFNKINISETQKNSLNLTEQKLKELQKLHWGSFNSKFAITKSQRLALCSYLSPMDIIPVNGPPGTGKTALLRAIFADYIVKTALKAKKSYDDVKNDIYSFINTGKPILGTSSVRQAINNIIEGISGGFAESSKEENILFKRWLKLKNFQANIEVDLIKEHCVVPQIRNSENKYENNILFTSIEQIFNYIKLLEADEIEKEYLRNINQIVKNEIKTIDEAIDLLFYNIAENIIEIENKIEQNNNLFETYEDLDTTIRFKTFFLSIHLLEAFFIINLKRLNKKPSNGKCPVCNHDIKPDDNRFTCVSCNFKIYKNKNIKISTIDDLKKLLDNKLEQNETVYGLKFDNNGYKIVEKKTSNLDLAKDINNIYLITPLFPMLSVTMHSLFGAFKFKTEDKYILIKDFFDLVLSDESGMILAPVGIPALYVAKKMVVVGDEKQIEPVYPFDEIIDKSIVKNISENIDYSDFKNNHSAIFTNFLSIANRSTSFNSFEMQEYEENSLWLKEHFRCKDEIIEYCNEIIYKGILIPKVRFFSKTLFLDNVKDKYPSMKIFNIESTVKNNSSCEEAKKITNFLVKHIPKLTNIYNKFKNNNLSSNDFYKHIGIVTPFNNQKKLIKRELRKANKYNMDKILVGTVHAFQGSEREIIIFSPAIDKNYNGTHFTNQDNGNMMNVAVSRAKSAFWVFGNKQGMQNAGEYTKKLVEYIEENFSCELKCPICNSCIIEKEKSFQCENYIWNSKTKSSEGCQFILWKENKSINNILTQDIVKTLLLEKEIIVDGKKYILDKNYKYFIKKFSDKTTNENICPKCGGKLIKRKGKFGEFYGCSNFQKGCRYTKKIESNSI